MSNTDQPPPSAPVASTSSTVPVAGAAPGAPGAAPTKETELAIRTALQAAGEQEERIIQGINLVHVLSTIRPDFISPRILACLSEVWESKGRIGRLLREEMLPIHFVEESKTLVLCLLTYSSSHRDDIAVLWKLLSAFRLRSLVDFTFLADNLDVELNASYSLAEKRHVLRSLLRYVENQGTSQSSKSRAFKHVIRPMLKQSLKLRLVRSKEVIREEQMRLLEERRSKDDDSSRKETLDVEKKEAKDVDLQASPAPSTDSKMELDEKISGGEPVEESASYAAAAAESHLALPPVWQEGDLLDTDMMDSIIHAFTAEHGSSQQDEVGHTHPHAPHCTPSSDEDNHNLFVNPADFQDDTRPLSSTPPPLSHAHPSLIMCSLHLPYPFLVRHRTIVRSCCVSLWCC